MPTPRRKTTPDAEAIEQSLMAEERIEQRPGPARHHRGKLARLDPPPR